MTKLVLSAQGVFKTGLCFWYEHIDGIKWQACEGLMTKKGGGDCDIRANCFSEQGGQCPK